MHPQPERGPARRHRPAEGSRILQGGHRPHRPAVGRGLDQDPEQPRHQRQRCAGGIRPAREPHAPRCGRPAGGADRPEGDHAPFARGILLDGGRGHRPDAGAGEGVHGGGVPRPRLGGPDGLAVRGGRKAVSGAVCRDPAGHPRRPRRPEKDPGRPQQ